MTVWPGSGSEKLGIAYVIMDFTGTVKLFIVPDHAGIVFFTSTSNTYTRLAPE